MFHSDSPHTYKPLSFIQRKQLSKFRLGMLHLRLETGRFVYPRLPAEERVCQVCNNGETEDEIHFPSICNTYDESRRELFSNIPDMDQFSALENIDKLKKLVNDPTLVKQTAKFIVKSFELRSTII